MARTKTSQDKNELEAAKPAEKLILGQTFVEQHGKMNSRDLYFVKKKYGNVKKTRTEWEKVLKADEILA